MELALKIICIAITWYAIGFAGMCYFRWVLNKDNAAGEKIDYIQMSEVFVLSLLGLVVILHLIWNNIYVWWHERKLPNNRK